MFDPFPPYFLVSSPRERIVPVPISSHMVWIFSLLFMQFFPLFFLEKLPISICDFKILSYICPSLPFSLRVVGYAAGLFERCVGLRLLVSLRVGRLRAWRGHRT
jgi:hypothetical protein